MRVASFPVTPLK
jgi:transposase